MPLPSFSFHSQSTVQNLLKNDEVNDRLCELQVAFKSSTSKDDTLTKDFISLLHRPSELVGAGAATPRERPSPDIVFEALLQSRVGRKAHPNGISSLASAFLHVANLSLRPPQSSSTRANPPCFDLYPLYGGQSSESDRVRAKDGYGLLAPDCFYDDRYLFLPDATVVLLILFNRNHNHIARRLFLQKEDSVEVFKDDAKRIQQDDDIFKKARLINCGHFRNILLEDVLKPLTGLPLVGPSSSIDFLSIKGGGDVGKGVKNNFAEAALLYDSSDIMSHKDAQHVKSAMQSIVDEDNDANLDNMSPGDFDNILNRYMLRINQNRRKRDYAGLPRGNDGYFSDLDLARILHEATECPASRTGEGISSDHRIQQIRTLEWARELKACSFVDYRKFLRLKVPTTFDEWTSNKHVAATAQRLYGRIENLELYVGLQLEDTVPEAHDSGFRFGYTKTYGLIVDIVSRIRNDPGLTTDISPAQVTSWGFQDCIPRRENGSFGASLPRLLQRTLPHGFPYNNVYGLFPFNTPAHAAKSLKTISVAKPANQYLLSKYDTQKPQLRKVRHLTTKEDISRVFNNPAAYPNPYDEKLRAITGGYGYLLGFDDEIKHDQDRMMSLHAFIPDSRALRRYADSFSMMVNELIRENTTEDGQIDVARDVINAVCFRWVSETLIEYPLQRPNLEKNGDDTTSGLNSKQEEPGLFQRHILDPTWRWLQTFQIVRKIVMALNEGVLVQPGQNGELVVQIEELPDKFDSIYEFVFQNFNQEEAWVLRDIALGTSEALSKHIRGKIPAPGSSSDQSSFLKDTFNHIKDIIRNLSQEFTSGITMQEQSAQTFLSTVVNANKGIPPTKLLNPLTDEDRIVANVLGLSVIASIKYAKVCTQAVNFYLREEYAEQRRHIIELSKKDNKNSKKLLMAYIREAYRLDHPIGLWRRSLKSSSETGAVNHEANGHSAHKAEEGDLIFADFNQALRHPSNVDPKRDNFPGLQGFGLHKCPGFGFVDETMPEIFKAIFRLENLRRCEDKRGQLLRFNAHPQLHDMSPTLFLNPVSTGATSDGHGHAGFKLGAYPQSLVLKYDVKKRSANGNANRNGNRNGNWKALENKTVYQERMKWEVIHGKGTQRMRTIMNCIIIVILFLLLSSTIYTVLRSILSLISGLTRTVRPPSVSAPPPPTPPPPTPQCPLPHTILNPWETITMRVGEHGNLLPIEYTLDIPTKHHLSFVDVDEKDMRMRLVFDNTVLGLTPNVDLNKSISCGDNFVECLDKKFSGGDIVLPEGRHTVRIEWAGVETPGSDGKIDWGERQGRRIGWYRVQCGA